MEYKINNLILELNYSCNNNCIYCYIPEKNRFQKIEGKDDFFKEQMVIFRKKGVENVDFTGGEPTLYPHLVALVKFSKKIGYTKRTLVTNGRLLSCKDYCKKIVEAGINKVIVSLDGQNKELTEAITRTPESFDQTISAIKNIKDLGISLGITNVINKLNYKYLPEIIGKSIDLGADFINIQFLLPYVEDSNVPCRRIPSSIIPSYKDSLKYLKEALDKYGGKKEIKVNFIAFCFMKGYEKYLLQESSKFDRQVINYGGYSYNIGEHLKKAAEKTEKCKDCSYNKNCIGFFKSYTKELGILNILK